MSIVFESWPPPQSCRRVKPRQPRPPFGYTRSGHISGSSRQTPSLRKMGIGLALLFSLVHFPPPLYCICFKKLRPSSPKHKRLDTIIDNFSCRTKNPPESCDHFFWSFFFVPPPNKLFPGCMVYKKVVPSLFFPLGKMEIYLNLPWRVAVFPPFIDQNVRKIRWKLAPALAVFIATLRLFKTNLKIPFLRFEAAFPLTRFSHQHVSFKGGINGNCYPTSFFREKKPSFWGFLFSKTRHLLCHSNCQLSFWSLQNLRKKIEQQSEPRLNPIRFLRVDTARIRDTTFPSLKHRVQQCQGQRGSARDADAGGGKVEACLVKAPPTCRRQPGHAPQCGSSQANAPPWNVPPNNGNSESTWEMQNSLWLVRRR